MNRHTSKTLRFLRSFVVLSLALLLSACAVAGDSGAGGTKKQKLDPSNPVTISIWHYYNGPLMNAFEAMVQDFNDTIGAAEGIIVESFSHGNVSELEKAVIASANRDVGSMDMPNIFASYADTAFAAEEMGMLANLDDYISAEEQGAYIDSYIEEGRIGPNGELKIFPVAKATETLMLNATDWRPFAEANNLRYDDLQTMEGVARVAALYYNWTDAQTPDTPNDGKAFFGRDSMANLFIIASMEFGKELFRVEDRAVSFDADENVMRKIWDTYYVPYISGYFTAYGRFRSDDAKVGDILAYVGSTSSASFFPTEVTAGGEVYPVEAEVLPVPHFEGAEKVMVQQGAGMVVTKATPEEDYAAVVFLKWFTRTQTNIEFAALSGYLPVLKEAVDYETFLSTAETAGLTMDAITKQTLKVSLQEIQSSELYTNKAFKGGAAARAVLDSCLRDKAVADREAVVRLLANGETTENAVARFNTDEAFQAWLGDMNAKLEASVSDIVASGAGG